MVRFVKEGPEGFEVLGTVGEGALEVLEGFFKEGVGLGTDRHTDTDRVL